VVRERVVSLVSIGPEIFNIWKLQPVRVMRELTAIDGSLSSQKFTAPEVHHPRVQPPSDGMEVWRWWTVSRLCEEKGVVCMGIEEKPTDK